MKFLLVFVTICVSKSVLCIDFDSLIESKISEAKCQSFCREKVKYPATFRGPSTTTASCNFTKCNCEVHQIPNITKALPEFNEKPLEVPQLKCKEDNLAHITWATKPDFMYFLEVSRTSAENNHTNFTDVTRCGDLTLRNLDENTYYKVRLWAVSRTLNQYRKSEYIEFRTSDGTSNPLPVPKIVLDELILRDNKYDAVLEWTPSEDKSCFYHFVWFGGDELGDYGEKEVNSPTNLFKVTLEDLEFETNYTVAVRARRPDTQMESEKTDFYIPTPSCLDSYSSLEKCRPAPPKDLLVEETFIEDSEFKDLPKYDVKLTWTKPDLLPAFYVATFKNLLPEHNTSGINLTVAGDQTMAIFKNVELGMYYHASLTAWSKMGPSHPAFQNRHVTGTRAAIIDKLDKHWTVLELILIVIGPLMIILLMIGAFYFIKYYKAKKERIEQRCKYFTDLEKKAPEGPDSISVDFINVSEAPGRHDEWELNASDVALHSILGEGAFGIVRRGHLLAKDGSKTEVAIKMLKTEPTAEEVRQFSQEIEIMKSVKRHLHVVSLIGCITKGRPEGPLLVVEYCSRGDLQTYLRNAWDRLTNSPQRDLLYVNQSSGASGRYFANQTYGLQGEDPLPDYVIQPKHLISIARQVALGMEHLARTRVVHRDLAARNVLVCEDHTVKVSDFGLSRDVYQDNVYFKTGAGKLPVRWMALESLTHQRYTTQSDVWSFGILLWEIVTLGGTPYATVHSRDLLPLLSSGQRLERPDNCGAELYQIMQSCWKTTPKDRPTFTELRQSLDGLLESVTQYLSLEADEISDIFKSEKHIARNPRSQSTERYVKPISLPR